MTDEEKALVERLRWSHWYYEDAGENTSYTSEAPLEAADLIETQGREIERLRRDHAALAKQLDIAERKLKSVTKLWHTDREHLEQALREIIDFGDGDTGYGNSCAKIARVAAWGRQ